MGHIFLLTVQVFYRDNNTESILNQIIITPVHEAGRGAVPSGTALVYLEKRQ